MKTNPHNAYLIAFALLLTLSHPAAAIVHDKGYGEPYDVGSKRIVFTTWYWVRPGQMDWRDKEDKSVFANKKVMAGPFDAHYINIDGPWGVRLTTERAQRAPKLDIKPEKPWESGGITVTQMLPTPEGKIMAWGTSTDKEGNSRPCYFESTDAINWKRPALNLVDYEGNKENNLTPGGPSGHVFIDPNAPPEERFKSASNSDLKLNIPEQKAMWDEYIKRRPWQVMATETDPGRAHAIFGFTSPDGLVWKQIPTPLTIEVSDGDQSVYFDKNFKKYVMYARTYFVGPRADGYPLKHERRHQFIGRRSVGRAEGSDFREFDLSDVVIDTANAMAPADTFYLNCHTWIPGGNQTQHLMFVSRYQQAQDITAIDLYTSYDGKSWHIMPGSPVLETNTYGEWDGGCIFAYPNLVERGDGAWMLLYKGSNFPHKYPRGNMHEQFATMLWPKGRLCAIEAEEEGGFTTPAFLLPGEKLRINAVTARAGDIKIEVADFNGNTLPGHSFDDCTLISGDQYRTAVKWKGGETLGAKVGEPVVLRFRMKHAKIYAMDFE